MPYTALPGLEGKHWRTAHADAGTEAMNASLLECLDQTKNAAAVMAFTAGAMKEILLKNQEPGDGFREAIAAAVAGLDRSIARTIRQYREIANQQTIYYAPPEAEHLRHTSINEAVNELIDEWPDFDYLETLEIAPCHPMTISRLNTWLLDLLLDDINEANTGEDGQGGIERPSQNLLEAEDRFMESALLECRPYWMEHGAATKVKIREWLRSHRPELLRRRNFTKAVCGHCRQPARAETMRTCPNCRRRGCARCWLGKEPFTSDWERCQRRAKKKQEGKLQQGPDRLNLQNRN